MTTANETPERTPDVVAWLSARAKKGGQARMGRLTPEQKKAHMQMMTEKSKAKRAEEKAKEESNATPPA